MTDKPLLVVSVRCTKCGNGSTVMFEGDFADKFQLDDRWVFGCAREDCFGLVSISCEGWPDINESHTADEVRHNQ